MGALLVSIVLGLLGAAAKLSGRRSWVAVATVYTTLIRGIPELVLMLLVFYGGTSGLNHVVQAMGMVPAESYPTIERADPLTAIWGRSIAIAGSIGCVIAPWELMPATW